MHNTTAMPTKSALKTEPRSEGRRRKQKLCFSDLEIYEFPLILGDNPHCEGVPLQLSWKPCLETVLDLDFYEFMREPRRSKKKFRMPTVDREIFLLSKGYSIDDILEACEAGRKTRKDRYNSFHAKKWDRFRVVMESAKEKLQPQRKIVTPPGA